VPKHVCKWLYKQLCKQRLKGQTMLKSITDTFLETGIQMFT